MPFMVGLLSRLGRFRFVALTVLVTACSAAVDSATSTDGTDMSATPPGPALSSQSDMEVAEGTPTTTMDSGDNLNPTPSQQEGPYYPVSKPSDRDSDLTKVDGEPGFAGGQVLDIRGLLVDTMGDPIEGATIEIWQTDENGIYLHPADPAVDDRDTAFQGYGESTTKADGSWGFRTVNPGYYEPRPRHIHLKILVDGVVVLVSQVYFSDDPDATGLDPAVIAEVALDEDGSTLIAEHLLVVER